LRRCGQSSKNLAPNTTGKANDRRCWPAGSDPPDFDQSRVEPAPLTSPSGLSDADPHVRLARDRSRLFALSISLQTGSQSEVTGRDWSPVSSTCSGTCGPGLNLRGQGASMCRCPERDKLRSLPRTRPRVALPQLMRARSGQRKHCSLLQRSSGLVGAPADIIADGVTCLQQCG